MSNARTADALIQFAIQARNAPTMSALPAMGGGREQGRGGERERDRIGGAGGIGDGKITGEEEVLLRVCVTAQSRSLRVQRTFLPPSLSPLRPGSPRPSVGSPDPVIIGYDLGISNDAEFRGRGYHGVFFLR